MAERVGSPLLTGYRLAGQVARPLIPFLLGRRVARGKEDAERLGERYGKTAMARPAGPVVWVHAASVGETNAAMPFVRRLTAMGIAVVFTTVTVSGAATARKTLPEGAIHQYAPVDVGAFIARFLAHWRPGLAILVEAEFWPATLGRLARADIPVVVINGRMSERSFGRWKMLGRSSRALFRGVALALAQSPRDAERLTGVGIGEVVLTGNLKFDAEPPTANEDDLAQFRYEVGSRPVWVAASTHPGEEETIAAAHGRMTRRFPHLVTVIVPRHPSRGAGIADHLGRTATVTRRGAGEGPHPGGIYIADTLGELGLFYRACPVAFLGGSLIRHGGQNPIEPVRLGAVVLHGPHVHNFADVYAALDAGRGAIPVEGAPDLAEAVSRLLAEPRLRDTQAEAADAALAPFSGALGRTLGHLRPFLDPLLRQAAERPLTPS